MRISNLCVILPYPTYIIIQLRQSDFTHDVAIVELSTKLEQHYADCFTFGHLGLTLKELYAPRYNDWAVFHLGLRLGAVVVLFLWVLW